MSRSKRPAVSPLDEELARRSATAALQPRSPLGTFAPTETPAPAVADRRREVLEQGGFFMPTDEEWEELSARAWAGRHMGMTPGAMSVAWNLPVHTIHRAVAHARGKMTPQAKDQAAEWATSVLENLVQLAEIEGDFEAARKAVMDIMKIRGIVSTGGNAPGAVSVNNNFIAPSAVGDAITAWIARQEQVAQMPAPAAIDGEIVSEDTASAGGTA